jgi:hypothetical protein
MYRIIVTLMLAVAFVTASSCAHSEADSSLNATVISEDVQFFPAGPEDKLFNQRRAIEEYVAAQAAAEAAESSNASPPESMGE